MLGECEMRIKWLSSMVNKELSFLLPRAIVLDIIIFLISLPVYKLSSEIPLGLALGTLVMTVNFIILGCSSERAVERTVASAKRYMLLFYIVRFTIMGCLFAFCVRHPCANVVAAAIPQLYPRIFYTLDAAVKKRKEGKDL